MNSSIDLNVNLSNEQFVQNLRKKALQSGAVNHPFLEFKMKNVKEALKLYAFEYSWYSRNFVAYLQCIMNHLDSSEQEILAENIREEMGHVDEKELIQLGIEPSWVKNIRHSELFRRFQHALGINMDLLQNEELFCDEVKLWTKKLFELCQCSPAMGLGAFCFGAEAVVKPIYNQIFSAIKANTDIQPKDYVFFPLHIFFDDDHAESLENISIKYAETQKGREELEYGMRVALSGRESLWNALLKKVQTTGELYDLQADKWDRKIACLSDLTARAPMFKHLNVHGKKVLDLGCGEGYCTRILKEKGAICLTGIDISERMIEIAQSHRDEICYYVGNVLSIDYGHDWDLITAIFLFNYLTVQQSYCVLQKCWHSLKENGQILFSVPHPCFSQMVQSNEAFYFKLDHYFSDRDKLFEGKNNTNNLTAIG
jgi:2-polyprenyl-3-methyl-5-hydroxy-6-metoxy-1,4-benzoquinol methylase